MWKITFNRDLSTFFLLLHYVVWSALVYPCYILPSDVQDRQDKTKWSRLGKIGKDSASSAPPLADWRPLEVHYVNKKKNTYARGLAQTSSATLAYCIYIYHTVACHLDDAKSLPILLSAFPVFHRYPSTVTIQKALLRWRNTSARVVRMAGSFSVRNG